MELENKNGAENVRGGGKLDRRGAMKRETAEEGNGRDYR